MKWIMNKAWAGVLVISAVGFCCTPVFAQNSDRDNHRSSREYNDQREENRRGQYDRFDRDEEQYGRSSQQSRQRSDRDQNSRADSNDSWGEWFSDLVSDDEQSGQGRGQSGQRGRNMNSSMQQFIRQHDENDDGSLSRNELPSHLRQGFDRLDRDGNDRLSQRELRQHVEKSMAQQSPVQITYVWVLDADQGRVRLNDLQQAYDVLTQIDQDGDGDITREELRQRQQQVASRWIDGLFQQNDENNDDQLSRDEVSGSRLSRRFERLDRNGDDQLTRSELRQIVRQNEQGSQQRQQQEERFNRSESASRDRDRDR